MPSPTSATTFTASDRELVYTRVFDAPRELVFKAWTHPDHLPRWWGPKGFTTTTRAIDVKPGGVWRFTMHGPDGRDYENIITFLEVVSPERLAYKHGGDQECEPVNFQVAVTFEKAGPAGDQTKLTMRMTFPSKTALDFVVREYGAHEGAKQHIDRLAEHLEQARADDNSVEVPFIISRVFNAPRDQVFKLWTQREHLIRWFGPKGATMPTCSLDLRPGGIFHYAIRMADGNTHWGRWVFREVVEPERLVFSISFSDETGAVIRMPFPGGEKWPLEWLTKITFVEHAGISKGTVVTVESTSINATDSERRKFTDGHASMREGWGGTLDRFAGFIPQA